jgi:hypothetical protein
MDLLEDILNPVIHRILDRRDSLKDVKRFESTGIEGWLKVEIVAALKSKVAELQSKGPNLRMEDNTEIELKAGTDFNPVYFIDGSLKYDCPCIFLGDASNPKQIAELTSNSGIKVVGYKMFNDGVSDWIIGMIRPLSGNR